MHSPYSRGSRHFVREAAGGICRNGCGDAQGFRERAGPETEDMGIVLLGSRD